MTKRGRPRAFDEAVVTEKMTALFWRKGFAATSLDDIAEATHVNRPSLYSAFGSKQDMYIMCLNRFSEEMAGLSRSALSQPDQLEDALAAFFNNLIDVYFDAPEREVRLGCFVFSSAVAEASENDAVRDVVRHALQDVQAALKATIVKHFPNTAPPDVDVAADTVVSTFLSLGTRVRAGLGRQSVEATVANAISATLLTLRRGQPDTTHP